MLGAVLMSFFAIATSVPVAETGDCSGHSPVTLEVAVRQAPLSVRTDFTLADLSRMAVQLSRRPPHPVLGFYIGTVGYAQPRVEVDTVPLGRDPRACQCVRVQAELVVTDRRIEIGRDLPGGPCRFRAALAHYRRHADAASLALERFAAELPGRLAPEIERNVAGHPVQPGADDPALLDYIGHLLDQAIGVFSASLTGVQAELDTPQEAQALTISCGDT